MFLNGIPDFTERPDPLDRSLSIQQPVLEAKKSEKVLETEWTKTLPRILGGVLDLLVMGLRRWDETPEAGVYRMADAVRWVTACLGDDSFERAYRENREAATEHGLACSPLAPVLMQFLDTEAPAPLGVGAGHRGQFRGDGGGTAQGGPGVRLGVGDRPGQVLPGATQHLQQLTAAGCGPAAGTGRRCPLRTDQGRADHRHPAGCRCGRLAAGRIAREGVRGGS